MLWKRFCLFSEIYSKWILNYIQPEFRKEREFKVYCALIYVQVWLTPKNHIKKNTSHIFIYACLKSKTRLQIRVQIIGTKTYLTKSTKNSFLRQTQTASKNTRRNSRRESARQLLPYPECRLAWPTTWPACWIRARTAWRAMPSFSSSVRSSTKKWANIYYI